MLIDYKQLNNAVKEYESRFREFRLDGDNGRTMGEILGKDKAYELLKFVFENNNTRGFYSVKVRAPWQYMVNRYNGLCEEFERHQAAIGSSVRVDNLFKDIRSNIDGISETKMYSVMFAKPGEIVDKLMNVKIDDNVDLYISPNMSQRYSIKNDDTFSLSSIVIDIDCHDKCVSVSQLKALCQDLKRDMLDYLPSELQPNVVNLTGRGVQMWWKFEKCAASLKWMVAKVYDLIAEKINSFFFLNSKYDCFELDNCYKTNMMHIFRLFGTYNTKGQVWSDVELIHKNVMNINDMWHCLYRCVKGEELPVYNRAERRQEAKNYKKSVKVVRVKKTVSIKKGYTNLLNFRCKLIEYVVKRMNCHEKYRNKLFYNYLYAAVQCMPYDIAEERARQLNNEFSEPLKEYEVQSICAALRDNSLFEANKTFQELKRYKQSTWLSFFNEVPKFMEYYHDFQEMRRAYAEERKMMKRAQVVENHQKEKNNRNDEVKRLSLAGFCKAEIARIVGICRTTVYNILKSNLVTTPI